MEASISGNVLIVDDDPEVRTALRDLVRTVGGTVREACDGVAALEDIAAAVPDLILTDVNMPRMDGMTLCKTLKSNPATRQIPVIMITTLELLEDRVSGIEAGVDEFLTKPVRVPELLARMRSLLRVKRLNETLESAENVIYALARAIEAKDKYTEGHTQRVTASAVQLGQAAGCSEEELAALQQGGILHDIGKIAVPDQILNKPGRLTPEEFEIIKKHPMAGYNICLPLKSLAKALPCIRWHHEKPNGKGYPDGLQGETIPRVARILAVADIYDAVSTKRPYRDALPKEKAFELLGEEAAKGGLDKALVGIFIVHDIPELAQA